MKYGQFNYHKIMFYLDIFTSKEEKKSYLKHLDRELDRVLECFEKPKGLSLRNYAETNIIIDDSCVEFCDFIKLMVDKYSPSFSDKRIPSNDQLQKLVNDEIEDYKKLKRIVNGHLNNVEQMPDFAVAKSIPNSSAGKPQRLFNGKDIENVRSEKYFRDVNFNEPTIKKYAKETQVEQNETAHLSASNEATNDTKIVWNGSASSLRKLFYLLAEENLLKEVPVEKKLNFINKFIVDKSGKKFQL